MAKFIILGSYTQQGIANIKDSPKRIEDFRQLCGANGAEMTSFHLTMGRYDFVVVVDAPDAQVMAKIILTTASKGAVSTETLAALSEQEFTGMLGGLP